MRKLVIVESPNKVAKIKQFLTKMDNKNDTYEVISSVGHIRELSTRGEFGLGIELDTMTPRYSIPTAKKKVIKEIKEAAKNADVIFLATDPDREGESIAWHIREIIEDESKQFERIVFNEITESAVSESIKHPR